MSDEQTVTAAAPRTTARPQPVDRLKRDAVGLVGVVFMAVATAAPITAMTGNVPATLSGAGIAGPSTYIVATAVLTIFSVGYVAMARHLTATGAFYGFISHGLGRVVGMASGLLCVLAYVVFEASLVGIFSSFARDTFATVFDVNAPWWVWAAVMIGIVATLGWFDANVAAKVLGFFLLTEIAVLSLGAFATLITGGGPNGIIPSALDPLKLFGSGVTVHAGTAAAVVGGNAGLALFFAFWSWVGFESTAMYGEESRDPKRIIPRATLIAVIGIGCLYVFCSWMALSQAGRVGTMHYGVTLDGVGLFTASLQQNLGIWAVDLFKVLLMTGSFACGMAFHQCAARYMYAMGREGFISRNLGRTHRRHGSPHIASVVQTTITICITAGFWVANAGVDQTRFDFPYLQQYVLLAVLGTMAILTVQALASFAVVGYFHVGKQHPETAHPLRTFVAPLTAGVAQIIVVYLLIKNRGAVGGAVSGSPLYQALPYIVYGLFAFGIAYGIYLRRTRSPRYETIGRILLDETDERGRSD
jgi:amino acid transporter